MQKSAAYIHPLAEVEPDVQIGAGTRIWRQAHIRSFACVGEQCNIGKGVYVESRVVIGSYVKIQNNVSLFEGVTIEDGVFIGPHVCFTNDLYPRAITRDGRLKNRDDWNITPTHVKYGASIGAGAVIVCGVTIGEFALVAAGAVVTKDVAPHTLAVGNPAHFRGYVCHCGHRLTGIKMQNASLLAGWCEACGLQSVFKK